ncbi:aminopeptidase N [Adhaeribacter aerolatus]|uniref:Aminopeptidase N n=1 Tax=Adhaeribacter aerolatus TaxID=670289 RepID=A0A512AZ64_9BACT|nr:aminopeptidase N [Adhaeribacter aerolatus]
MPVEPGISQTLATYRKQVIRNISYQLAFQIPASKNEPIPATETITFELQEKEKPLQLDFKEKRENLAQVKVNGRDIPVMFEQEHLIVSPKYLKTGKNEIYISFAAGNLSLNRNEDYLYTLLVPDRARTVFPCFDQPDLKATFKLTLTLPRSWQALTNAALQDSSITSANKTLNFGTTDTISTYLFSFAAGKFRHLSQTQNGRPMHFYHRETDQQKIAESLNPIFKLHHDALTFLTDYTQLPYPFQKFDFVAIPDFQYNGMEHVGAIQYKAASLFLDEGATQDQKNNRSNLIAHETAHMWFGDLVTMRWFNDVWMKEVFANFMADKITQQTGATSDFDLKFLTDHYLAAYSVDRTAGANPIRQPLTNLQEAGTLYGNIIYHKAPIVMRQLELLMGPDNFRQGIREYLKKYANGNASWPELIQLLDTHTPINLAQWSQVWVSEPGRPEISYELLNQQNKISKLIISQKGEDGSDRIWPQQFTVSLVYPNHTEDILVHLNKREIIIPEAAGKPVPDYLLFNPTGLGYGLFPVDTKMLPNLFTIKNPVSRASALINLYENMLRGRRVKPAELLRLYAAGAALETEELNLKLLTNQLSQLYWQFTLPEQRHIVANTLENTLWQAMIRQKAPNNKKLLFKAYQHISLTKAAQDKIYQIWQKQQAPAGVKLTEDDFTALALALAVQDYPQTPTLLETQYERIQNPDRKKRFRYLWPALSGDQSQRDSFFNSLKDEHNREQEAWVVSALEYLHHPLRQNASVKYLPASLELLQQIQLTGDIFFPASWLQASLGAYQSTAAAKAVRQFLQDNPHYNPKLKAKILQATHNLFRAEELLSNTVKAH